MDLIDANCSALHLGGVAGGDVQTRALHLIVLEFVARVERSGADLS